MKKLVFLLFSMFFATDFIQAQECSFGKQFGASFGIRRGEIPSAYTNADGIVFYTFEGLNLNFDASLWSLSNRLDIGPYLSLFGSLLWTDISSAMVISPGTQFGVKGHFHLLANHQSPSTDWDLTLNAMLGAQYCRYLPFDFGYGVSFSSIFYPHPHWGILFEIGIEGFLYGRFFRPIPTENNSILRLGVSHRF